MNNPPYFPSKLADQLAWFQNFSSLITTAPATYGLVAGDATAIAAVVTPLQAAYDAANDPTTRTAVTVAARNTAFATARGVCFPYATTVSADGSVNPSDKTALGVTNRSTVRTIVPTPTARPVLNHASSQALSAVVAATNSETPGKKGAPLGCTTEVFLSIGTVAATDPTQCNYIGKRTKWPTTLSFDAGDVGKIATVTARYTKRNGTAGQEAAGPYADLISFTII